MDRKGGNLPQVRQGIRGSHELELGPVGRRPLVVHGGDVVEDRGPQRDPRAAGDGADGLADGVDGGVGVVVVVARDGEARRVERVAGRGAQLVLHAARPAGRVAHEVGVGGRPGPELADPARELGHAAADLQGERGDRDAVRRPGREGADGAGDPPVAVACEELVVDGDVQGVVVRVGGHGRVRGLGAAEAAFGAVRGIPVVDVVRGAADAECRRAGDVAGFRRKIKQGSAQYAVGDKERLDVDGGPCCRGGRRRGDGARKRGDRGEEIAAHGDGRARGYLVWSRVWKGVVLTVLPGAKMSSSPVVSRGISCFILDLNSIYTLPQTRRRAP